MGDQLVEVKLPRVEIDSKKVEAFQSRIIKWHSQNGRNFPWRETSSPFHVLIAEILLKLTGARKVIRVYPIVVERFGTPKTMAEANTQELIKLFKPLGLTKRAYLLKEISSTLICRFKEAVPSTYEELINIRGIGNYTANAILCLAFHKRTPLVDGSTSRIFSRCFQYFSDKPAYADKRLWELAEKLLPKYGYREYNLGLLDLGAAVCKYPNPYCSECPITNICDNFNGESISMKSLIQC